MKCHISQTWFGDFGIEDFDVYDIQIGVDIETFSDILNQHGMFTV